MHIITPIKLIFHYDEDRHVGALANRLSGGLFNDARGTIKAIMTDDPEEALKTLKREIGDYIANAWFITDKKAKLGDFSLEYACTAVVGTRFWAEGPPAVVRLESRDVT